MTREELAQQYADEIIENKLRQIVLDSFLRGYELGELHTALTIKIEGVTYVDLGLPSGTLWSSKPFYQKFCHDDAQKLNIPTEEQCLELISKTKSIYHAHSYVKYYLYEYDVEIIGATSQRINASFTSGTIGEGIKPVRDSFGVNYYYENRFWIKGESNESNDAPVLMLNAQSESIRIHKHFTGYKLPVFLVKNKGEV